MLNPCERVQSLRRFCEGHGRAGDWQGFIGSVGYEGQSAARLLNVTVVWGYHEKGAELWRGSLVIAFKVRRLRE